MSSFPFYKYTRIMKKKEKCQNLSNNYLQLIYRDVKGILLYQWFLRPSKILNFRTFYRFLSKFLECNIPLTMEHFNFFLIKEG